MKPLFTIIFIAIITLSFSKQKNFTPPGTVQVNPNLFFDKTEISNFSWQEYEYSVKKKFGINSPEHAASLPDTLVWRNKYSYNEPYVKHYYRHPAYKDYPVVGISYGQAVAYCKWRTQKVNARLLSKNKFKNQTIEYRLPTKQEWEVLASTDITPIINNGKNEKGFYNLNCVRGAGDTIGVVGYLTNEADVTAPVESNYKHNLGFYNIYGNVAEMTQDKGICKGGAWNKQLEDCDYKKDLTYSKPEAWVGFRCVCVKNKNLTN